MCCALAALAIALIAVWRGGLKFALKWGRYAGWDGISAAIVIVAVAGTALAAKHLDHIVMLAHANDRMLTAEIRDQPICRGGSSSDGASNPAQNGRWHLEAAYRARQ
jgi:hypothetical protein